MNENKSVVYPNELLENMRVEGTIFPENASDVGIATLSHEVGSAHILRIYQLLFNNEADAYDLVQELAAFTFQDRIELVSFLEDLPHLNGLEMLMLLNPLDLKEINSSKNNIIK